MDLTSIDNGRTGKGLLFVISSVSGGGKTTVIGNLLGTVADLRVSVSHTTRKPRQAEVEGQDYHFTSTDRFEVMIEKGQFLEWAQVYGHYYGTLRSCVDSTTDEGLDVLLDIDVQGALQVKARRKDAILIFIVPPGEEEQERRLRERGTENDQDIKRRLEAARQELAIIHEYHYSVLNEEITDAVDAVRSIIRAERCRNRKGLSGLQKRKQEKSINET